MKRIVFLGFFFIPTIAKATISSVTIQGITNTQAVLTYIAPTVSTCSVAVSTNSGYSPLINDVNATLFPGSNIDNRDVSLSSGTTRQFEIGARIWQQDNTGFWQSRALANATTHYFRITCGGDTATGSFYTSPIPYGFASVEPTQVSSFATNGYPLPITRNLPRNTMIVDPLTGAQLYKITTSSDLPTHDLGVGSNENDNCSRVLSTGTYLCTAKNHDGGLSKTLYSISSTTLQAIYLGRMIVNEGTHIPNIQSAQLSTFSDFWDKNDPNTIYAIVPDTNNVNVLIKGHFDGDRFTEVASNSTSNFTWTNLTPSLGGNDIGSLAHAYAPALSTTTNNQIGSINNNKLVLAMWYGQQDSAANMGVYDIGNGLPIGFGGTGAFVAMAAVHAMPGCRWSSLHFVEGIGDQDAAAWVTKGFYGNDLGDGPYQIVLSSNITTSSTTFIVTSSNTAPHCGQPYSVNSPIYLQDMAPNDIIYFLANGGEVMLIKSTATVGCGVQLTVQRGYQGTTATSFSAGTLFKLENEQSIARGSTQTYTQHNGGQCYWRYLDDPTGTDPTAQYNWGGLYPGHRGTRLNISNGAGNISSTTISTPLVYDGHQLEVISFQLLQTPSFAGFYSPYEGSTFEGYPNISDDLAPSAQFQSWSADYHQFIGGNLMSNFSGSPSCYKCSNGNDPNTGNPLTCDPNQDFNPFVVDSSSLTHCAIARVGGASCTATTPNTCNTYKYQVSDQSSNGVTNVLHPRIYNTFGVCHSYPPHELYNISGPGSVIDDSKPYTFCVAEKAGECRPDSGAGYIYGSCPSIVDYWCQGGENEPLVSDMCIGDWPLAGGSILYGYGNNSQGLGTQTGKILTNPPYHGWGSSRELTQTLVPTRSDMGGSSILTPGGEASMFYINVDLSTTTTVTDLWFAKIPPLPTSDSIDRTSFVASTISLVSPTGLSITSATITYGYIEDNGYCTGRQENCVVVSSYVNVATPFYFASVDTITYSSCTVSCNIVIPLLPMHVAKFTANYYTSSKSLVSQQTGLAWETGNSINPASLSAPSITFSASPTSITSGGSSTLTWVVNNSTTTTIDNGIGAVSSSNSTSVSPTVTTTYTLSAWGLGGFSSAQATVTVTAPSTGGASRTFTGKGTISGRGTIQ